MYVIPGIEDAPATVVWLSKNAIHQAVLEAVPDTAPVVSPSVSPATPSAGSSASPIGSAPLTPAP
jgi:hypothetical protein